MQKLKLSTYSFADVLAMKDAAKANIGIHIILNDKEQVKLWTAIFKACNDELGDRFNDAMQPLPIVDIFHIQ